MKKTPRARYTLEFKQEAVPAPGRGRAKYRGGDPDVGRGRSDLVQLGQGHPAGQAHEKQTPGRPKCFSSPSGGGRRKAAALGALTGVGSKVVSADQMEITGLRAELAGVKVERDILGKATAYFAKAAK